LVVRIRGKLWLERTNTSDKTGVWKLLDSGVTKLQASDNGASDNGNGITNPDYLGLPKVGKFGITNPEQLDSWNSLDVILEFIFGDAGEVGEFFEGDELVGFFV